MHRQRGDRLRSGRWQIRRDGRICLAMEDNRPSCRVVRRDRDGVYRKYEPGLLPGKPMIEYAAFVAGDRVGPGADASGAAGSNAVPLAAPPPRGLPSAAPVATPVRARPAPAASTAPSRARIAALQQLLRDAGHDPGPIDGLWGARSRQAMQRYQAERGLPPSGQPDADLLAQVAGRSTAPAGPASITLDAARWPTEATGCAASGVGTGASARGRRRHVRHRGTVAPRRRGSRGGPGCR